MQRSTRTAHCRFAVRSGWTCALALGTVLNISTSAHAQNRPPLNEPIALEGTMKQFYKAANVVIVTTMDGVEHVYHFTKDLIIHGGKAPGVDALEGLREGTTVVIHEGKGGSQASAEEIDVLGDGGLDRDEYRSAQKGNHHQVQQWQDRNAADDHSSSR
jgi:hypothetical protein